MARTYFRNALGQFASGPIFVPDPTLWKQIQVDPGIGRSMERVAQEALRVAQNLAPVGETGDLKQSLHIEAGEGNSVSVVVAVDYWLFPEYGVNQPPQPYLRPALSAVGLKLT
jgi:hypothetical protein